MKSNIAVQAIPKDIRNAAVEVREYDLNFFPKIFAKFADWCYYFYYYSMLSVNMVFNIEAGGVR